MMQAALNGLIEKIQTENAIQDARHDELGLERRQNIVGIIQVAGQLNAQFGSNVVTPQANPILAKHERDAGFIKGDPHLN